jgi:hypothetical protein
MKCSRQMGEPNWSEVVQAIAAIFGVAGIGAALVYSGMQTKELQRQIRMQTEADERGRLVERAQLDLSYYAGSPAVRDQFTRFQGGYQGGVRTLLGIDQYQAERSIDEVFDASDGYGRLLG